MKAARRFNAKEIGARVRKARENKGWSAEDLANRAGLSKDALYKKERGTNPFFFDELNRIAEALEAPPLFPILDWHEARLVERLLRDEPKN